MGGCIAIAKVPAVGSDVVADNTAGVGEGLLHAHCSDRKASCRSIVARSGTIDRYIAASRTGGAWVTEGIHRIRKQADRIGSTSGKGMGNPTRSAQVVAGMGIAIGTGNGPRVGIRSSSGNVHQRCNAILQAGTAEQGSG